MHHHRGGNIGSWCRARRAFTAQHDETFFFFFLLAENESTYIPGWGATHRIENPGKVPLHIIEVQSRLLLWARDDIVRFEDTNLRAAKGPTTWTVDLVLQRLTI